MEHSNEIHAIASAVAGVLRQERLGLQKALEMIRRAEQMSLEIQVPMAISVVDEGGNLIAFHRMDDSLLASIAVSQSKAYTAAALRCSTKDAAKMILPGEALYGLPFRRRCAGHGKRTVYRRFRRIRGDRRAGYSRGRVCNKTGDLTGKHKNAARRIRRHSYV